MKGGLARLRDVGPPPNNRWFGGTDSKEAQVQYVGIDWAYRRAAWCARREGGEIAEEGLVPADEDGLARLVLRLGCGVRACVEMMSGAVWVRDRLQAAGWRVEVADARKVKGLAPLACKTDKVDARVLAELCRRDLVPAVWLPSLDDRALRERLKRRMHVVRMRTMARNRIHGVLTQWGLKLSTTRLRQPDALRLLDERGMPEVWRRSVAEALALIDLLDERLAPLERELRPLAKADPRVALLETIPGIGPLLGLTIAAEIGDISRFASARKLIGFAGLAPKVRQSGQSSRTGPLSKAGSKTLRWAAIEAAQQAWRETNPWHQLYRETTQRQGKTNAGKAAVARKVLIATWHVLSRNEPFKPCRRHHGTHTVPASSHFHLAA
jgi:transposase